MRLSKNLAKLYSILGIWQSLLFAIHKVAGTKCLQVRVPGFPKKLACRTNHSDIRILWQVFGARDLEDLAVDPPRLIIDGGANVGYTSAFFAHRFPQAKVIAVEPDPGNCSLLRDNCQWFPNVRLIQGGLWTSNTSLTIENPEANSWAFRVREAAPGAPGSVPGVTVSDILRQEAEKTVDILKLDVEGAEEALFSAENSDWLECVRVICVECHGEAATAAVLRRTAGAFSKHICGEKWVLTRN